jgi:hypothetical protein
MAKVYYYYKTLRKAIIQCLDLFNDIYIARFDNNGNAVATIQVPLKFGPKEKAYYWMMERSKNMGKEEILPIMTLNLVSIDFDGARMANKHDQITVSKSISAGTVSEFLNPTPYNISFSLNIWALHMVDVDQILEQILPYFQPYVMAKLSIPEMNTTVEMKIIFQSASPDISDEMGEEDLRVVKWSCSFVAQTYLFQPVELSSGGIIKEIIRNYYIDLDTFEGRSTATTFTSAATAGELEVSWMKGLGWDPTYKIITDYQLFDE